MQSFDIKKVVNNIITCTLERYKCIFSLVNVRQFLMELRFFGLRYLPLINQVRISYISFFSKIHLNKNIDIN